MAFPLQDWSVWRKPFNPSDLNTPEHFHTTHTHTFSNTFKMLYVYPQDIFSNILLHSFTTSPFSKCWSSVLLQEHRDLLLWPFGTQNKIKLWNWLEFSFIPNCIPQRFELICWLVGTGVWNVLQLIKGFKITRIKYPQCTQYHTDENKEKCSEETSLYN